MNTSGGKSTEFLFNREAVFALMVNSGFYRHRNLRNSLQQAFIENRSLSDWNKLTIAAWEVLYFLIESYIAGSVIGVTDIPYSTNLSASTARRALRKLEQLDLAVTTSDRDDKRRILTALSPPYRPVVDDFIKGYENGFAALIQRHDRQERLAALQDLERTKEELEEQEALLLQASKLAALGHWVWNDQEDNYLYVSEENARIFGMSLDDFVNRKNIDYFDDVFVHPDDKEDYREQIREADNNYGGYDVRYRIITPEGELRHIREISQPVLNEKGVMVRSIGTTQDITEYVRIEQALRESEYRFKQLLDVSQELMAVFIPDGTRIFVNQAFCAFVGKSEAELLENKAGAEYSPEEKEIFRNSIFQLTPEHPAVQQVYKMNRFDGQKRDVLWLDHGRFDDKGTLVEVHCIGHDVTE